MATPTPPPVIDVEFVEEKMPERPRALRSVSLPAAIAHACHRSAEAFDRAGLDGVADRARTGAAIAEATGTAVDAVRDLGATLARHGVIGSSKRIPLRRKTKPTP